MPIRTESGRPVWQHRTGATRLALWAGWLALVALFIYSWQVMTETTIWAFVYDGN